MVEKSNGKKDGRLIFFVLIGLVGLALLIFGSTFASGKDRKESTDAVAPDPEQYASKIEEDIERICGDVAGNCTVEAVVSLDATRTGPTYGFDYAALGPVQRS